MLSILVCAIVVSVGVKSLRCRDIAISHITYYCVTFTFINALTKLNQSHYIPVRRCANTNNHITYSRTEFANKVILITGASAGIGADVAKLFAKLSANLALVGRNQANLNKVAQACEKYKVKVLSIVADVTNEKDVERIVQETISTFGKLDVLVNNAGIVIQGGTLDGLAAYDSVMTTNVRAVYELTGLAAPHLIKTKGNIVNVSSVAPRKPAGNSIPYRLSKAALDMLTKCVALELAPHGIRVNSVNPGPVKTGFGLTSTMSTEEYNEMFDNYAKSFPLGRGSEVDEVSEMIVYLSGHRARGMTGSLVAIDNGFSFQSANFVRKE